MLIQSPNHSIVALEFNQRSTGPSTGDQVNKRTPKTDYRAPCVIA